MRSDSGEYVRFKGAPISKSRAVIELRIPAKGITKSPKLGVSFATCERNLGFRDVDLLFSRRWKPGCQNRSNEPKSLEQLLLLLMGCRSHDPSAGIAECGEGKAGSFFLLWASCIRPRHLTCQTRFVRHENCPARNKIKL